MPITVEDGTGLLDADSLVSVEDADTYHHLRNSDWSYLTLDQKESGLKRASAWLTNHIRWKGIPLKGRGQSLAWPRSGVYDKNGFVVPSDEVPPEVANAAAELALREARTPGYLSPDYVESERVIEEEVGPLKVRYASAVVGVQASQPSVPLAMALIGGLTATSSSLSGTVSRI